MALIDEIRLRFVRDEFEFSRHAVDQTLRRDITVSEIREAISIGEVIEDYPNDKYGPSCLILGYTRTNRPLHLHVSYPSRPIIKLLHYTNRIPINGLILARGSHEYTFAQRNDRREASHIRNRNSRPNRCY
jgi:hypothetical protein